MTKHLTNEEIAHIETMLEKDYISCSVDLPKTAFIEYWPDVISEEGSSTIHHRLYPTQDRQPDGVSSYQALVFCFLLIVLAAEGDR